MKSLLERPCLGIGNGLLKEDQRARPACLRMAEYKLMVWGPVRTIGRNHLAALIAVGLGSWIVAGPLFPCNVSCTVG
jgi:hypothetical protein